ncbi:MULTISPECIES: hypothetical protein [Streptomyces]|uniref:hypothetical protein n=1 Tax=Streptomyces TaxID=1883 RepID=UPI000F55047B|nr:MULTISPECIES: hypothetical protein [Streptomyces]RPK83644.1 hypothetical protein EES46_25140 [Streptomyces sp. ADI98-10]
MPKSIVLLATPEGWRHSVLTREGGTLCGRLTGVPADADPAEAQAAVAAMVVDPPREPGSWTAQVTVAATPPNNA